MNDAPDVRLLARAGRVCLDQADALQQTLVRVHGAIPPPGSAAGGDERALLSMVRSQDRQRLWADCVLTAMHQGVHVADHVRSLGLLLSHVREQSAPVYAHATLARGAVESAAWLRWLLADGEPFPTRFGRGIALLIEDIGKAAHAAEQLSGKSYLPKPALVEEHRKQELLGRLAAARIETTLNAPGTAVAAVRVNPTTDPIPVSRPVSGLVQDAFADLPAVYSLLSGVAHARPWGLADSAQVIGRDASWRADPVVVTNSVLICLLAAHRTAAIFAAYRGFPDDAGVQQMRRRHDDLDRELVTFGRRNGHLAVLRRPTST
ncbi:hypothetical protein [Phytohabitans aurantiacus]|uniref:Uncharacterized protein n=1 Tax=Phytohabitans aurantiacus TaxID=3016789 RepID=A0ABQ5QWB3_9ACTN|nr:hypothetical protein [Phytohabitans aurantiacus]GLH98861.1 hypothetical protein Pa4123_41360 [Phytohabitans aurantiacus]